MNQNHWDSFFVLIFFYKSLKWLFSAFFSITMSLQMVISRPFFANMACNFFRNLQTCHTSRSGTKIGVPWPLNIVLSSMNSKTWFFFNDIWFMGPNFPMKPFGEGHKILHDGSCNNKELPFKIWRNSKHFCSHNKKRLFIFRFRGPLLAFLGTP